MELHDLLDRSGASEPFKAEVRAYLTHAARGDVASITTARYSPRVKVLRVIAQLLHEHPALPVERVHIDAHSGCSDFVGTVTVQAQGAGAVIDFTWCCSWRANEEGWVDCFGLPDQMRAAREFDWRCFARWEPRDVHPVLPAARDTRVAQTVS